MLIAVEVEVDLTTLEQTTCDVDKYRTEPMNHCSIRFVDQCYMSYYYISDWPLRWQRYIK